jgi:hypothetical protein
MAPVLICVWSWYIDLVNLIHGLSSKTLAVDVKDNPARYLSGGVFLCLDFSIWGFQEPAIFKAFLPFIHGVHDFITNL